MNRNRRTYYSVKSASLLGAVLGALALWGTGGTAGADEVRTLDVDKAGRVMLNVRGGLAVGLANTDPDLHYMGAAGIDLGVALSADYNAYLVLTPQLDVLPNVYNVMVPLGFQYDIRLARGLYLYPRVSLGYSALISNSSANFGPIHLSASHVTHGGIGIPELGIKYVVNGRFNLGVEPVSFPIFFTDNNYAVWYRALAFLGGNF